MLIRGLPNATLQRMKTLYRGRPANGLQAEYRPGCLPLAIQGACELDDRTSITTAFAAHR